MSWGNSTNMPCGAGPGLENAIAKSKLKRLISLKTKRKLNLILKPPATFGTLQGLLLSLAKPSEKM